MKDYQPSTPRKAFGLAAVALTALTIGMFVVVPAQFGPTDSPETTLAKVQPAAVSPIEVEVIPNRIEVIGIREPEVAEALVTPPAKSGKRS